MLFGEKSTEASVTGNSLVATFHKANPPLVWKFDLERNHSFTLALQGEEGDWELGLTSPKGDFYPITHFLTRDDAEEAFRQVNKALAQRTFSLLGVGFKIVGGLVLVGVVVFLFTVVMPFFSGMHRLPGGLHSPLSMQQMPQGVPLPANAFLRPPGVAPAADGQSLTLPEAPPPILPSVPLGVPVPADEVLKPPH